MQGVSDVKTATIPSLRVESGLREAAESVLREGETLSSFVEQSLKANIQRRQIQKAFIEKGLASREEARRSGEYFSAEAVLEELGSMLKTARRGRKAGA
jgi:predicted transcriptional regulator